MGQLPCKELKEKSLKRRELNNEVSLFADNIASCLAATLVLL
jgi:hypothetical protein